MGQFLTSSITVTAETSTTVSMRLQIWYNTTLNVVDSNNSFTVTGNWPNLSDVDKAINGSGAFGFYDTTQVFTKTYGAAYGVSFSASFTGVEYWGASNVIYASGNGTVQARAWDAPAAPTGVTATRNSDTSHTITWTRNSTATAPYEAQRVYRATDGGSFIDITGLISATATSYTDTTTSANHQYQWKVMAGNSTSAVLSAATSLLQTTPTGPSGAVAAKSGVDIVTTWTNNSSYGKPEVWHASNGVWEGSPIATLTAGVTSYTHISPSALVTHTYRIFSVSTTPVLQSSAYTDSSVVQLAAAPNAPTGLGATPNPNPVAESATLFWTHNPIDSSPQSKREIQRRKQGTVPWTSDGQVTSATASVAINPSTLWGALNGEAWEWQVRTWGQHVDPSPWSATSVISFSSRPTATISAPGATLTTSEVTLDWSYFDAEGSAQSAWTAQLLSGGTVLTEAKSGIGAATSVTFDTLLPNVTAWSVTISVADSVGLWSTPVSQAFTVDYALPPTPGLVVLADSEYGRVLLEINNPLPGGAEVVAASNDIYRSIDGGDWQLILSGIPLSTVVTDWSAPIMGLVTYKVVAISGLPSTAPSLEASLTLIPTRWSFLSTGAQWSELVRFWANPKRQSSDKRDRALEFFEGRVDENGHGLPVQMIGSSVSSSLKVSAVLTSDSSTPDEVRALGLSAGDCLWRDPTGRYWYCSIDGVDIDENTPHKGLHTLSFVLRKVGRS